ncbi:kinesin-like protein KIF2A isoform X1 [Varroa destructor]|uniref:Kinesin-like protein n=1 Tax=Varroa destructor TaxID=109461 RepID=A0A7M7MDT4_VARDE|nr:kinesin-like protein KIF2A isoform X1 [Varroa destructor]
MAGGFQTGDEIFIKRSNGAVHPAIITTIKGSSVQVEWNEHGETKGKELSISDVIELNRQKENHPAISSRPTITATGASSVASGGPSAQRGTGPDRRTVAPQPSNQHSAAEQTRRIPRVTSRPIGMEDSRVPGSLNSLSNNSLHQDNNHNVQTTHAPAVATVPGGNARRDRLGGRPEPLALRRSEISKPRNVPAQPIKMARPTAVSSNVGKKHPHQKFLNMIEDYRHQLPRMAPPANPPMDQRITVAVRKRPLGKKEITKQEVDVITVPSKDHLIVHEPKTKLDLTPYLENTPFRFDYAFDESSDNELVYRYTAKPLVKTVFEGGMATCFAYGQTGSGKTHTMGGTFVNDGKGTQQVDKGIYYFATKDVFATLRSPHYVRENLVVCASFFEIYGGKVFDLLAGKKLLRILEDGKQQVQVVGLSETRVQNVQEVLQLLQQGNACRTSGTTSANAHSSRSHAVFQLTLYRPAGREMRLHGRFSLIDLAGNERGSDTGKANDRNAQREAADINKGLLALKECIRALGRKGAHLPFRGSRLTHILKDSFVGEKSRTCMIAMISPGMASCDYTLNTLRYADRVKELAVGDPTGQRDSPVDEAGDYLMDRDDLLAGEDALGRACAQVQDAEQVVWEQHQDLLAETEDFLAHLQQLRSMANDPDYDVMDYTVRLNDALGGFDSIRARVERLPEFTRSLQEALVEEDRVAKELRG